MKKKNSKSIFEDASRELQEILTMTETLCDATDIIQSIISSHNQEHVPEIELQLVSRALQHLDLNVGIRVHVCILSVWCMCVSI